MSSARFGALWLVAGALILGLAVISFVNVRLGGFVVAGTLVAAALLRLMLPRARAGGLVVRSRTADVAFLLLMGLALLVEGTLAYLGLSVKPPKTSLGSLLQQGFAFKERSQRMIWLPGLAITSLSWAFNVIADGLRDAIGRQEIGGGA